MNCQDFEIIILNMARAQLMEASARRQALAHIAECPACADRLTEQQALTAAVRATARSLRDEGASAHVEQSLRTAVRKQMNAAPAFSHGSYGGIKPIRARQWTKRTLAAVAAVLLLVLLAGAIRQWSLADRTQKTAVVQPSVVQPSVVQPSPPARKDDAKFPERLSPESRPEREPARYVTAERRRGRHTAQRNAASSEEATSEFIALADQGELAPLESGQVLRVELPASTLISMGLPITAEDVSKSVLADLLVGQDGLARAIRFVRPGEAADGGSLQQPNNKRSEKGSLQ